MHEAVTPDPNIILRLANEAYQEYVGVWANHATMGLYHAESWKGRLMLS